MPRRAMLCLRSLFGLGARQRLRDASHEHSADLLAPVAPHETPDGSPEEGAEGPVEGDANKHVGEHDAAGARVEEAPKDAPATLPTQVQPLQQTQAQDEAEGDEAGNAAAAGMALGFTSHAEADIDAAEPVLVACEPSASAVAALQPGAGITGGPSAERLADNPAALPASSLAEEACTTAETDNAQAEAGPELAVCEPIAVAVASLQFGSEATGKATAESLAEASAAMTSALPAGEACAAVEAGDAGMEKRTDPSSGRVLTLAELQAEYESRYSKNDIEKYWGQECKPLKGGKGGKHAQKKAKSKRKA